MVNKNKPEKGYVARCKKCNIKHVLDYRTRNEEWFNQWNKDYYQRRKNDLNEVAREWCRDNHDRRYKYLKNYYDDNKDQFVIYNLT